MISSSKFKKIIIHGAVNFINNNEMEDKDMQLKLWQSVCEEIKVSKRKVLIYN